MLPYVCGWVWGEGGGGIEWNEVGVGWVWVRWGGVELGKVG